MFPWAAFCAFFFLAHESLAFVAVPSGLLRCQRTGAARTATVAMAKGKMRRNKANKTSSRASAWRERDATPVEGGEGPEQGGEVPRLVVMDLDYTLW